MKIEEYIGNHPEMQIAKKKGLFGHHYVYQPTGAKMTLYRRYIKSDDKQRCREELEKGSVSILEEIRAEVSTNNLLTLLVAKDGSCAIVEQSEYIPHDFVPLMDPVFVKDEKVKSILKFVK